MGIDDLNYQLVGAITGLTNALRAARQCGASMDCDRIICDQLLEVADEYHQKRASIECAEEFHGHELKSRLAELFGEQLS
jgi:hypothetical protein